MDISQDRVNYLKLEFQKEIVKYEQPFSNAFLKNTNIDFFKSVVIDQAVVRIVGYVATQNKQTNYEITFESPRNWWWHLLQQIGFKKIKTGTHIKHVVFEEKLIFPNIDTSQFPGHDLTFVRQNNLKQ